MKKPLTIITSYYPPEIGAASNRIYQLANGLQGDFSVTVLTPLPNYPEGKIFKEFKGRLKDYSEKDGISVRRLWILPSNSKNKVIRLMSMISYSLSLLIYFLFNSIPKTVIIQSPPLLVAFTSVFFLRSKKRKLVLNISDLWPDAGLDLGAFQKNLFFKLLKKMESFIYRNAQLVLGQSQEILDQVVKITTRPKVLLYRNYPQLPKTQHLVRESTNNSKPLRLVYAGLLGVAQGIVALCNELSFQNIEFHIYGSGPETNEIESLLQNNPDLPIFYHGSLDRETLHGELIKYDLAIIPLVKRIYGSVPSKIFEMASLGLPVLYFGGGEGENIVLENNLGWVISPKDYEGLNRIINSAVKNEFKNIDRKMIRHTFELKFNNETQLNRLKEALG
ncbi:glycosyltransferase family 4 protein [Winogradskyella aurantiaca]|uniref:glycosyltransferase family 4 protein n=1 Tax=Winogradskyella aurantiaca TaxID=2219558 RepID=UPI000E1CFA37|nr:glycosyltransferase family 4 protein [Winogradskyella aurantiaca]